MPSAPNVEGLPLWLQLAVSIAFVATTMLVAIRGYLPKPHLPPGGDNAQIIGAQFADMGAVRRLADCCIELGVKMEGLEAAIREDTHWRRDGIELLREACQRLRELREHLERRPL